jgi:hypothetical protein
LNSHCSHFPSNHGAAANSDFYGCAHILADKNGRRHENIPGRGIVLERYISGIEGTVECAIVGKLIHPLLINEKLMLTEHGGTVLENLLISPPTSFTEDQCEQIRQYAWIACARLV